LPLHVAATAGAALAAVEECVRIFPDAPRLRNGDGFLPHQLALEFGHRALGEALAARAGKAIPNKLMRSVLQASSAATPTPGTADDKADDLAASTGDAPPAVGSSPAADEPAPAQD
jgi:hypothetical protein